MPCRETAGHWPRLLDQRALTPQMVVTPFVQNPKWKRWSRDNTIGGELTHWMPPMRKHIPEIIALLILAALQPAQAPMPPSQSSVQVSVTVQR